MGFFAPNQWILGVDTGGTYTDAALICPHTKAVLHSAKALTTKGDLSVGVKNAIGAVLQLSAQQAPNATPNIAMLCLSTTLATNAVVEGHGGQVGVLLAGFDAAMQAKTGLASVAGVHVGSVAGGHDYAGQALDEPNEAELDDWLAKWAAQGAGISAYAVAASFAVRNPAHEWQLRDWIQNKTGKPVSLSCALSSSLDAPRRALTAALNARLLGHIEGLVAAVQKAQAELGLSCPLMMVRGDGSLLPAAQVQAVPIETIMSGPAASLVGAAWLSELDKAEQTFMISDMGGTTTDIALMQAGKVRLNLDGAWVGGFRTMVQAVDVQTQGLGGDSAVEMDELGALQFASHKAVPLSLLAARYPEIVGVLEQQLADSMIDSMYGIFALLPFASTMGQEASQKQDLAPYTDKERAILQALQAQHPKPIALRTLAASPPAHRAVKKLAAQGALHLAQITPSDAAHVTRQQSNWDAKAAELGLLLACKRRDMRAPALQDAQNLAQRIVSEAVRLSCHAVLRSALPASLATNNPVLDAVCRGEPEQGWLRLGAALTLPLLAVGGPARVYYPLVAERLQTPVRFVDHAHVANAVGAAVAPLRESREISILGSGSGVFHLQSSFANERFHEPTEALARARTLAQEQALTALRSYGPAFQTLQIQDLDWSVAEQRTMLPMAKDQDDLQQLLQISLKIEAQLSLV